MASPSHQDEICLYDSLIRPLGHRPSKEKEKRKRLIWQNSKFPEENQTPTISGVFEPCLPKTS